MNKVRSFEVFDTLLTRKVGVPRHIFLLTGMKANEWEGFFIDPEIFTEERLNAEKELNGKNGIPDIHDIYFKLAENLDLSPELRDKILELELEIEFENIIPVTKHVQKLKKMRVAGIEIVYISDMYLNEKIIRKLLAEKGILQEGEKIYVSCDYNVSKKTGSLFKKVIEDLGIKKTDLHHFGNSKSTDVRGAKKAGVLSTWMPGGNLNRYEKLLCSLDESQSGGAPKDKLYYSRMAASSRISRLSNEKHNKHIFDVSASVAAPVLYLFVTFLLEKVRGETLYFLSRDGYILYNIARKIAEVKGLSVDLRYIYISREVLTFAKLTEKPDEKLLKSIKKTFSNKSVIQLLEKVSVQEQSIRAASIPGVVLNSDVSNLEIHELKALFHAEEIFRDIKKDAFRRKKLLEAYLENVGLFSGGKVSLVDVGWNLTIHDMLVDLFNERHLSPPDGYYFGINLANSYISHGKKTGFLWDLRKNGFSVNIPRKTRVIEVFCSAPHGQTVDYMETGSGIKPVFNDYETRHLLDWGIMGMEEAILCFTEEMIKNESTLISRDLDINICCDLIEAFWMKPTRDEIEVWGVYPFFISDDESRIINLHKKKPLPKLIYHALKNRSLPKEHEDSWPVAHFYSLKPLQRYLAKLLMRSGNYLFRSFP